MVMVIVMVMVIMVVMVVVMVMVIVIMMITITISSHLYVEAQGQIEVPGTLNSQFIYLVSNVSIVISGIVKSQRSDCITDELCHYPVRISIFLQNF